MADDLLKKAQDVFEGQIDFEGQRLAELITTILLSVTGLFAFLVGYIQQNIYITLWVGLGGAVITFLMVVPPWPIYNDAPEKWLPAESSIAGVGIEVDGRKIN
ncbi:MAG: hypothetical protein LQ347_002166 [Umbilicaria vellea]|nr:MAG: hypothetical protein LQ347_002166 [Umbilicaria vellea]